MVSGQVSKKVSPSFREHHKTQSVVKEIPSISISNMTPGGAGIMRVVDISNTVPRKGHDLDEKNVIFNT